MDVYSCCYLCLVAKGQRKQKTEVLIFSLILFLAKIKKTCPNNHETNTGNGTLSYHWLLENYLQFSCLNFLTVNFPLYVGNKMTFSKQEVLVPGRW